MFNLTLHILQLCERAKSLTKLLLFLQREPQPYLLKCLDNQVLFTSLSLPLSIPQAHPQ